MERTHRNSRIVALAVVLALISACASAPADRVAFTTIKDATLAVHGALGLFSEYYSTGKVVPILGRQLTEADRTAVKDAYEKFQKVNAVAITIARNTTGPTPIDVMKTVSDAAWQALDAIRAFTGGK